MVLRRRIWPLSLEFCLSRLMTSFSWLLAQWIALDGLGFIFCSLSRLRFNWWSVPYPSEVGARTILMLEPFACMAVSWWLSLVAVLRCVFVLQSSFWVLLRGCCLGLYQIYFSLRDPWFFAPFFGWSLWFLRLFRVWWLLSSGSLWWLLMSFHSLAGVVPKLWGPILGHTVRGSTLWIPWIGCAVLAFLLLDGVFIDVASFWYNYGEYFLFDPVLPISRACLELLFWSISLSRSLVPSFRSLGVS